MGWIEDLEVTTEQNGKSATELQIENELPIDRWIDIAYDENGDEIADDETEMLQAQESIRMEFTSIPDVRPDESIHRRILKRELQAEALKRLESSARTEQEFSAVTEWWDRLDRNRQRRERAYKIFRGDVPLEHEMSQDGGCIPRWLANPTFRQICRGNFWDYFAYCLFEMHNLTAKEYIREIVMNLKLEHKEILFLLGLMTALPTTVHFADFKQVYLLKNQFICEEAMDTLEYLKLFFPFEMPAFAKGEKGHVLNLTDRTMIALAMTFRTDPQAVVMTFMRNYGERYDWLVEVFRDWAFTFMAAFLYYHDKDSTDETTLDLYRQGMAAFDGNAPTYHIELRDKPTIVWDFHSLLMGIKMVLSFKLTDDRHPRANAHKTD